ncbi:MAG: uroporphyrinogen-III synthase [Balneolaceae bacterium]
MSESETADIFVTRELTDRQIQYARDLNLNPVIQPAIRIVFRENGRNLPKKLEQHEDAVWVFTSRNGVEGFKRLLTAGFIQRQANLPPIFTVGEKTGEAFKAMGLNARSPARQDATGLAELLIRESGSDRSTGERSTGFETVLHWCGNRSRKELKQRLSEAGLNLVELEVYRTELNRMDLPEKLGEAVLFYSPSAVEAFRQSGGFNRKLPELFAIGNTTGEALSLESGKNVHIPAKPSTENLLDLAAEVLSANY